MLLCHRLFSNRSIAFLSFFFFLCSSYAFHLPPEGGRVLSYYEEDTYGTGDQEEEVITSTSLRENENEHEYSRRSVAEEDSYLVLAPKRTLRKDPVDDFKPYHHGWNITNKHYLASVAFTAVPFFIIAGVWFAIFGLALFLACCCFCCCKRKPSGYSGFCYALSLTFLVLFTIAAIIGCIFLYTGQGKFYGSTTRTLHYIADKAFYIVGSIKNVSLSLSEAKNIGVDDVTLPKELVDAIGELHQAVEDALKLVSEKTDENLKTIKHVVRTVRRDLIILAAVMLLLAFLGFLFAILGFECLVYILVVFGWLMVTSTFILCGVFLVVHNVVVDTCVAMDEWVANPTAHTALDDLVPCVDKSTAQDILKVSEGVTHSIVGMVDVGISTLANDQELVNYNQSGPEVPLVCNPFTEELTARTCEQGEVGLSQASEMLKKYECESKMVGGNETCVTTGRLTPKLRSQMNSAVNLSYGLYHYTPVLVELQDCAFVRSTFKEISKNNCPELGKYTNWIYCGLLAVSAALMFSLVFWVICARERRHRVYTKQFNVSVAK